MKSPEDPLSDSLYLQFAHILEGAGNAILRISRPVLLLIMAAFITYSGGGTILERMEIWEPSYLFLSASRDAYLLAMTFLGGLAVCTYTTGLISPYCERRQ